MSNDHSAPQHHSQGTDAMTALAALRAEGIDPAPYFSIVADNLLARHGSAALRLADEAIERLNLKGDREGEELWREVAKKLVVKAASLPPASPSIH